MCACYKAKETQSNRNLNSNFWPKKKHAINIVSKQIINALSTCHGYLAVQHEFWKPTNTHFHLNSLVPNIINM